MTEHEDIDTDAEVLPVLVDLEILVEASLANEFEAMAARLGISKEELLKRSVYEYSKKYPI